MDFFLSLTITLCFILLVHHLRAVQIRRQRNLPPGQYGLPLIGETLQLVAAFKSDNPQPFIEKRVARFGLIFTTHLFGEPTVFSADPEFNRFVLQNEFKLFESSYPTSIANLVGKHSLLLMKDRNLHKRLHTLTITFAGAGNIRDNLFGGMDSLIRSCLNFSTDQLSLMEETKKIAFALTLKLLMSVDPCDWTDNLRNEYLHLIGGFFAFPLPFFFTSYSRAMKARKNIAETLTSVVRQRKVANEQEEYKKDIIGALLHDEASGRGGKSLSDEEIADFLVAILVAGFETTSSSMTLAVKFLTETPLALAQLKEEQEMIRTRNGGDKALDWDDYKSMPFTQCVIDETLRFANIVGGIFRRTTTDINIKGYTIPRGWKVITSSRAVHMNDQHFKDAQTFNPWRWQNDGTEVCSNGMFTPFGGGPRLCPGFELARVSLSVFLHHFVTKYSWDPTEDDKLVFFPTTGTQKQYPIYVHKLDSTLQY